MFVLILACGTDKPTQPQPVDQSSLLLSKLVVSMVPGGSETVTLSATDANGSPSECAVSNSDPGVASVTITDSTMQITGLSYGITNLTITNGSGKSCILPVEVYDKNILDVGEFLITYTDNFISTHYANSFIPIVPEGFYALGGLLTTPDIYYPDGMFTAMAVKPKPGSDAIAFTDSFTTPEGVYSNVVWKPIPPAGYKAMGYKVTIEGAPPDSQACIREDLTITGAIDSAINIDNGYQFSSWAIGAPFCGPHSGAYLAPGTFIFCEHSIDPPTNDPLMNVLNVDLPMLAEAPDQEFAPRLTSLAPPPDVTAPMMEKALLAPFSVITDMLNDMAWQMDNSPTYRVKRQVFYKCLYHNYNQTDVMQTNNFERVVGISTTQSEEFRTQAGISISAELGVSFSPAVSAKIAATVSYEVGYRRLTGITEFEERHVSTSLNIPPSKAGAIWQRYNRFTLYRHNGNAMEVVGVQEIGIESYVTDVYPDN